MYVLLLLPWTHTEDITLNYEYNKLDATKQIAIGLVTITLNYECNKLDTTKKIAICLVT